MYCKYDKPAGQTLRVVYTHSYLTLHSRLFGMEGFLILPIRIQGHQYLSLQLKVVITMK